MSEKWASERRHIALFVPSLRGGGAERVMVMLANGFAACGHRVDLVLTSTEGPYLPEVTPQVRIVDLDKGRVLASLLPLARYLRRERPDAMLSALNHANIIAIVARKLARVHTRLVVSERSAPSRSLAGHGRIRIVRQLMGRLYPSADAIVCVSQAMRDEMLRIFGLPEERLFAVYNPLDINHVQRMMLEPVDHPWLNDRAAPVILAAGRLTEVKDYPTLLAGFSLLRANRQARLIILGEGEERTNLERIIIDLGLAGSVDLVGFRSNPFGWMASCNAFILSSRHEGFPNVLVQAMACGARVVSTDCPTGPREILEDGKWGRLVPVGDAEALAKAMADTLDDTEAPDARKALERFDADTIIMQYERFLLPPTRPHQQVRP